MSQPSSTSSQVANGHRNRVYGLDILRSIAITSVMIGHANYLLPGVLSRPLSIFALDGVSIFFVLSGFLIGGILLKDFERQRGSISTLITFWKRRWFRTLPPYLIAVAAVAAIHYFTSGNPGRALVLRHLTFTQNLCAPAPYWFFPESWSLSVEEWFYLTCPVLILAMGRLGSVNLPKATLFTAAALILAIIGIRFWRFINIPHPAAQDWDDLFRKQVITRLDSIMFGVIGAHFARYHTDRWLRHKWPLLYTGIAILILNQLFENKMGAFYDCVISFSITSVGTLFLLPYLSTLRTGNGPACAVITHISLISYSMYLTNFTIVENTLLKTRLFSAAGNAGIASRYAGFWVLTVAISTITYKLIEVPITNLRDLTLTTHKRRADAMAP